MTSVVDFEWALGHSHYEQTLYSPRPLAKRDLSFNLFIYLFSVVDNDNDKHKCSRYVVGNSQDLIALKVIKM